MIRLKGVKIWFFTPFFVFATEWWNIHTQIHSHRPPGRREKFHRQGHNRNPASNVSAGVAGYQQDILGVRAGVALRRPDTPQAVPCSPLQRIPRSLHRGRQRRKHSARGNLPGSQRGAFCRRVRADAQECGGGPAWAYGRQEGRRFAPSREGGVSCLLHAGGRYQSLPLRLLWRR